MMRPMRSGNIAALELETLTVVNNGPHEVYIPILARRETFRLEEVPAQKSYPVLQFRQVWLLLPNFHCLLNNL